MQYAILGDGTARPVAQGVQPIGGYDETGKPKALKVGADGGLGVALSPQDSAKLDTLLGLKGGQVLKDGTAEGDFIALKAATDLTINSITASEDWEGSSNLAGVSLFAGDTISIGFTEIDITGVALLYNR